VGVGLNQSGESRILTHGFVEIGMVLRRAGDGGDFTLKPADGGSDLGRLFGDEEQKNRIVETSSSSSYGRLTSGGVVGACRR
jgi:hypothetical protein